jgi:hypothetical protein
VPKPPWFVYAPHKRIAKLTISSGILYALFLFVYSLKYLASNKIFTKPQSTEEFPLVHSLASIVTSLYLLAAFSPGFTQKASTPFIVYSVVVGSTLSLVASQGYVGQIVQAVSSHSITSSQETVPLASPSA